MSHVETASRPNPGASSPHPTEAAIEAVEITKHFGSTQALRGVTFTVPRGSVFGVIGPNGAGKTTTMRALLDIIRPSSGYATVLGTDSRSAGPALRRRIGFLPGELILEGRVTGRKLLQHYTDISGPVRTGRIEELAERFHLDLGQPVRKLSRGNKQKLGIVQAFMHEPELLVLDEPTSGLDPLMQQEFLLLVKEVRDAGQTVFLSSHVISEIQQAADEVAVEKDDHQRRNDDGDGSGRGDEAVVDEVLGGELGNEHRQRLGMGRREDQRHHVLAPCPEEREDRRRGQPRRR